MEKEISKNEKNFEDKISLKSYRQRIFNHEEAFRIAGYFVIKIFNYCEFSNETVQVDYLGDEFKRAMMYSDVCFLMSWMIDDPGVPGDWREAILFLHSNLFHFNMTDVRFSATGILTILNFFVEYKSARYNFDFTPLLFFVRSMFFEKNQNFFGWNFFNDVLLNFSVNANEGIFNQFLYENDLSSQEKFFNKKNKVSLDMYNSLSKKMSIYNIKPLLNNI